MRKVKKGIQGSKWEPDSMRHGSGSQTDQGEVLDDCCHVTSASGTIRFEGHVITIASFFERELR